MSPLVQACPKCARPIQASAPKGLCPVCLVSALLDPLETGEAEEPAMPAPAGPAEVVGHYRLLEELGRGGMGVVFRALDQRLNRIVALKLLLAGRLASDFEVKRFRIEAEAAAGLEHPHIVPIHEVGEADGRHYFAMKFMEGGTLSGRLRPPPGPGTPEAPAVFPLADFIKIVRAVHHAHQRGILHRDLKPGNILLDAAGEPAVSDFGLAKRLGGPDAGPAQPDLTLTSAALGSPAYMAPEQAAGRSRQVTTAADIYSLGAVLYHLLAGRPPFVGDNPLEVMRQVVETEPQPPSRARPPSPSSMPAARRITDLDVICLKCLEKDPAARYGSAADLAEDLERWDRGEPIQARPAGALERVVKWARRRPAPAALLLTSILSLAGFVVLQRFNATRLTEERDKAQAQEQLARQSAQASRRNLYAADMFLAARALEQGNLGLARRTLAAHEPKEGEEDLRGFEWRHYWHLARGRQELVLGGFSNAVTTVAFSADSRWLAAGGGNLVRKWNATNGELVASFQHNPKSEVNSVAFSPDGSALWAGETRGQIRVWLDGLARPIGEITRGTGWVHLAVPAGSISTLAISERNGSEGDARGNVALYTFVDLLARNERGTPLPNSGGLAAFSRDGRWLLTGGGVDRARLHHLQTGTSRELGGWTGMLMALALSPDATRAAVSPNNGTAIGLYDLRNGRSEVTSVSIPWRCRALAFAPDGQTVAAAAYDHTIRVLHAVYGYELHRLDGHTDQVLAVAYSPDGRYLASAGKDGTVRRWNLAELGRDEIKGVFAPMALSHDGRTLHASSADHWGSALVRHDLTGPARPVELVMPLRPAQFPDVTRRHNGLIHWRAHGGATPEQWTEMERFIERDTNRILWRTGPEGRPNAPDRIAERVKGISASAADGSVLAMADRGKVRLWHNLTSRRLPDPHPAPRDVRQMALTADGSRLAVVAGLSNVLAIYATATGSNLLQLPPRGARVNDLAFSPDGRTLALAGEDAVVELRDAGTGALQATLSGHDVGVETLAFAPDGRTLVTLGGAQLKFWNLPTYREVGTLTGGGNQLAFSGDGSVLLVTAWNGEGRVLRAPFPPQAR